MLNFFLGLMVGAVSPLSIMIAGGRYIAKHPEYVAKMLAKKMVKEINNSRKAASEQLQNPGS